MRKAYDSIYAYDFNNNTWHYDCKYVLIGNWWWYENLEEKAMPLDKWHINSMKKIISENEEDFWNVPEAVQWQSATNSEGRPGITKKLSKLLENYINPNHDPRIYYAREVTFDYSTNHAIRVDYMKFKPVNNSVSGIEKGDFYCYEVKSSLEDFHSANGHNFIGDYNYYVMPEDVFSKIKNEILGYVGVFVPKGDTLVSVKKARRIDRKRPVSEMLLMMFRSAMRDVRKA